VRGVVHDNLKPKEAYELFLELKQEQERNAKKKAVAKK
jgi:hypothetical protein